ncbi:hypothetical protein [Kutzneria buriramensis]|uniref:hypothetical protein n=1 Tax=Kutzneria buriramensis TaxID=1045776 RepID=UPI000E28785E|nr:hypothetical protein [Kutzneria buriramensis]
MLTALSVCALATASTMLVLYLNEQGTNASLHQQIDHQQRTLTDTNRKLAAASVLIDQLNAQTDTLNGQVNTLTASNTSLNTCVAAMQTWLVTLDANPGAPDLDQLARTADSACGF